MSLTPADKRLLGRALASAIQNEHGLLDAYLDCHDEYSKKLKKCERRFIKDIYAFASRHGIKIPRIFPLVEPRDVREMLAKHIKP
jgi:hypothetical protein